MKPIKFIWAIAFIAVIAIAGCKTFQQPANPNLDPAAEDALKKMSDTLGKSKTISFTESSMVPEVVETGQVANFLRETKMVMRRPNMLYCESKMGNDVWTIWYKGRTVTILDNTANAYATLEVPNNVEGMLDTLSDQYNIVLPGADFLLPNPYKALTADVNRGNFVGVNEACGMECEHLIFSQEDKDWQIWIHSGKEYLPRKILIDYKMEPGRPQFSATLSDIKLGAKVDDSIFTSKLPAGAKKVEMAELLEMTQGG